jgi:hypothetical protein
MVCEYTFYEATPSQIDLQVGVNNAKTTSSGFTTEQLNFGRLQNSGGSNYQFNQVDII